MEAKDPCGREHDTLLAGYQHTQHILSSSTTVKKTGQCREPWGQVQYLPQGGVVLYRALGRLDVIVVGHHVPVLPPLPLQYLLPALQTGRESFASTLQEVQSQDGGAPVISQLHEYCSGTLSPHSERWTGWHVKQAGGS